MLIHQFFVFVALLPPISGPLEVSFNYHFGVPSNHNDSTRAFIENHDLVGRKYGVPFRIVKDKDFPEGLTEPRVEDQVDTTLTSKAIDFIRSSSDKPFFLYFTPCAPHTHVTPAASFCCAETLIAQRLHEAPKAPDGWEKSLESRNGRTVFTKSDLKEGESLVVKFYQRKPLETNQSLEHWVQHRLISGNPPIGGKWSSLPEVVRQTGNLVNGTRAFEVNGKKYRLRGLAVCVDNVHVRFVAGIGTTGSSLRRQWIEAEKLMVDLVAIEKEAAKKEDRGLNIEANPPTAKNLNAGGPLKPGRYVGNAVYLKDGKAGAKYDLVLFENGEYEFLTGGKKYKTTGQAVYSNATGRLNLSGEFVNSTYDPEDDYCVFGKEKTGKWVIYAREGRWQRKLVWVSESDRPTPSEAARAQEIAIAEAKRYKHVVEPGQGVREEEIEAMMYAWETNYRNGALQLDQESFLLMKDGRVLDGLPVAPDVLDVAASRSREPDRWGWWKKEDDGRFTFAWPVRPREYRQPKGKQVVGVPFEKGTRLKGDFGTASTSTMIAAGYSSVRRWGIKLSKNGRFLKYRNGSTQSGGVPGMPALSTIAWDDEGSVASTIGDGITALSKRKKPGPGADRMGTYELDGFRMTLKFDDGRIEHHATFTDGRKTSVWFEGSNLSRKSKKK